MPHACVDRVRPGRQHLVNRLLVLQNVSLQKTNGEKAHLVGVLAKSVASILPLARSSTAMLRPCRTSATVAFFRTSGNLETSSAMKWALYDQSPRNTPTSGYLLIAVANVRLRLHGRCDPRGFRSGRTSSPPRRRSPPGGSPGVGGRGRADEHHRLPALVAARSWQTLPATSPAFTLLVPMYAARAASFCPSESIVITTFPLHPEGLSSGRRCRKTNQPPAHG